MSSYRAHRSKPTTWMTGDLNGKLEISRSVHLKKNQCDIGNEVMKVPQSLTFVPNSYGDRFIPRRYEMNDSQRDFIRPKFISGCIQHENDFLCMKNCDGFWRRHAVKKCLETNFNTSGASVLSFHDYQTKEILRKCLDQRFNIYQDVISGSGNTEKFDWPCLPRRKAVAVTEISHVLKNYSFYSDLNVITWSKSGNMAASFGEDLVLWVPKGKSLLTYEMKGITCLAYNYKGNYLAVGVKSKLTAPPEIQIWDVSSDSIGVFITSYKYHDSQDEVRCVVWDPKNEYIISGMVRGIVYVHKCRGSLKIVEKLVFSTLCVRTLQISTNQVFLAASDNGGKVFVWNLHTFETVLQWEETEICKTLIAWHPWKESYLIIARKHPASICLIDVRTKTMIAYYNRTDELCRIDSITFNPKSAELVVGVTIYENDNISYEIVVLASLDRVVDLLNIHDGSVKCLLWNSDGTMLATAGNDNMLNIWNFFGYPESGPNKWNCKKEKVASKPASKFMLGNPSLLR